MKKSEFAQRLLVALVRAGAPAKPVVVETGICELFLKLPVPQRKVAREVILALARAEGVLPPSANA